MIQSPSIAELSKALVEFHLKAVKIKKTDVNPFFKSMYASLSTILDVVDPVLAECGLSVIQIPEAENVLTTLLVHTSGEYIGGSYVMTPKDNSPQGLGSAITYQRRYALGALLSLNIDVDDDGNSASKAPAKPEAPKGKPAPEVPAATPEQKADKWLSGRMDESQVRDFKTLCLSRDILWVDAAREAIKAKCETSEQVFAYMEGNVPA